jgi:Pyruvate/2-oxoacid:ferredoxin oxidoreductase delta subunit/bacterioferritin-associated ferredoxin
LKLISLKAVINQDKCIGCGICSKVCPTATISIVDRKACIDEQFCRGCGACEQRCPVYAVTMVRLEKSYTVEVDIDEENYEAISTLCRKAHFNPEQILCYCTKTRAEEVAAAILKGAKTPEAISRQTGIRTGCKVECIQPILRLLAAADIDPERPKGWQWYGKTATVWDISQEIKDKYNKRGFYFDEDLKILNKIVNTKKLGGDHS